MRYRPWSRLLFCAVVGLMSACSGQSDEQVIASADAQTQKPDQIPVNTTPTLSFEIQGDVSGPRIALEADKTADNIIQVRILIRDIDDLYALATHLVWDPTYLKLTDSSAHLMLQGSGYETRTIVKPHEGARLLLGAARFRSGGSPWSSLEGVDVGKQLWATLAFEVLAEGSTVVSFDEDRTIVKSSKYEDLTVSKHKLVITLAGRQP